MQWDVSPVRPWEWEELDAYQWTLAQEVQRAIREGLRDGKADAPDTRSNDLQSLQKRAIENKGGGRAKH